MNIHGCCVFKNETTLPIHVEVICQQTEHNTLVAQSQIADVSMVYGGGLLLKASILI